MTRALAFLFLLCAAGCATTNGGGERAAASPAREQARRGGAVAPLAVSSAAAPAAISTAGLTVTFRMPQWHDARPLSGIPDTLSPLSSGHHRWEIGYSSQSKACRDSGLAWCRDIRNMAAWLPGAQIVPIRSGWALPGQYVTEDSIYVSSLSFPFALWGRAWSSVPGRWTFIGEREHN